MDNFETFAKKIGQNIKYFRKDKKVSQKDLATRVLTTQSNISDYENGKKLNLTVLFDIAKELDVSIEELLFSENLSESNLIEFPISKFMNKTYYCYYLTEMQIQCLRLKVYHALDKYHAKVKIKFYDDSDWKEGILTLDNKFAIVGVQIFPKNKFYVLTFNYHHDSNSRKYIGGIALLHSVNHIYASPYVQLCAISSNEISMKKQDYLKSNFLDAKKVCFDASNSVFMFKIDSAKDEDYYWWLIKNFKNFN